MGLENNIQQGWKITTIGDLADLLTDYVANGSFASLKENVTYLRDGEGYARLIRLVDHNKKYEGDAVYLDKHSYDFLKKSKLYPKDLIISNVGEYSGTVFRAPNLETPMSLGPNSVLMKFGDSDDYMFYFLQGRIGQFLINAVKSGSANPKFNKTEFKKIEFIIPPLPEQKAIAKVLTAFDDKIELLQAQNKTLETMAQTIFKEWFGKYQIGDELPEGWRVGKLGDIAKHLKNNIKPFDNPNKLYHHYSLPAYDDGLRPVNELGFDIKSNKYSVENNSFLVSKLNPFTPRIWTIFNSEDVNICSTEFQVVKPNEDNLFSIVHCLLNSKYFTDNLSQKIKGTSSSHQRVNPEDIFEVDLVIPNKEDLIRFEKLVIPMITKKGINHNNIQSLTKTRDTLLPKLMSGQVRVNNI